MVQPFIVQKHSNHGTTNPIVARLSVQTSQLLQVADLTEAEKGKVTALYFENLQRSLLRCHDAIERLKQARDGTLAEVANAVDQGARSVPFVIGLVDEVNTFLFEAKMYLRDLLQVFNVFFGTDFADASRLTRKHNGKEGAVVEWAIQAFGSDGFLTKMLSADEPWIAELVKSRNAVEHPEEAGPLIVENFRASPSGIIEPTWRREGKYARPESPLFSNLAVLLDNLLTLGEDVLVDAIRQRPLSPHVGFQIIPPNERSPECPIRVRSVLTGLPPLPEAP
jgi:hypothetical protein